MLHIDSKTATREILSNIQNSDIIKAKIVLSYFDHIDQKSQRRIISELYRSDDHLAITLLVSLVVAHPQMSDIYPTLQETIVFKAFNNPKIIIQNLYEKSVEQMYYVELVGTLRLQEAVKALMDILNSSKDCVLLHKVIEAIGAVGAQTTVRAVAEFIGAEDPKLVNAAIQALGHIGTPAAMESLAGALGKDETTDQKIMDIFGMVQDEVALHQLNTILGNGEAAPRNYSKGILLRIGPKVVPLLLDNLDHSDVDHQIHSLNILQEMGDDVASQPIRNLINTHPKYANVRFAAYEALACLPRRKGDYVLAGGLNDPVEDVRLAAAQAIDHNMDTVVLMGVQNMVRHGDEEAVRITKAVIDAKAQNLFIGLIEEDFFQEVAVEYLATKVHPDIRELYITLLNDQAMTPLVEKIISRAATVQGDQIRGKICVVDDSPMILNIYRRILNNLRYAPVLFQCPAEALTWLKEEKPLAVCTDLNMPDISGIEFTRRTRVKYSKDELPIIMVTTQEDSQDYQTAFNAGVSVIMGKPFDKEELQGVLHRVL